MTEAEAKEQIESLSPSLEATVGKSGDDTEIVVLRLAEDGWMGWCVHAVHSDLRAAHALALADIKRRLQHEAELATELNGTE